MADDRAGITGPPAGEISLSIRPPGVEPTPEENFAERQRALDDARWNSLIAEPTPEEGMGTAPKGEAGSLAGSVMIEEPSAVLQGLKAGTGAFLEGGKRVAEGLADILYGEVGQTEPTLGQSTRTETTTVNPIRAAQKVFQGLMSMGFAPFVAMGAGGGQALENAYPELANTPIADSTQSLLLRTLMAGRAVADLSEEERRTLSQPMTAKEGLELAITYAAPALIPGAVKGAKAVGRRVKEAAPTLLGERGAVGPPAVPPGGEPPAPGAVPPQLPVKGTNLARVGDEAIKDLIAQMNVKLQEEGRIKTAVISRATTAEKAQAKGLTIDRALRLNYEDLHVNATALRDLRDFAFRELREAEIKGASDGQLAAHIAIAGLLEERASATATDIGRALSAFNLLSDAERAGGYSEGAIARLAQQIQQGIIPGETLRARLTALHFKEQRQTFARQLVQILQRGQQGFYEAWINGLLSNPVSHAANTISNALVGAWGVGERQIAGFWNILLRDPEGVHPGEAIAMLRAAGRAANDGATLAARALRTGEHGFGKEKMEVAPAIGRNVDLFTGRAVAPGNPIAGFWDYLGTGIRLPSRLMMTEDAFFKGLNYRMELAALAYREGKMRKLKGDDLAAFIRAFEAQPSAEAREAATQFGLVQTFNNEFNPQTFTGKVGLTGRAFQNAPLGRLIVPFMRTPTNIASYVWRRTPVLSLFSESLYRDLAAGGAARDFALARVSTAAMLWVAYLEYAGAGLMTGSGASEQNRSVRAAQRQLGFQPFSMRVGDELYKIDRLSPPGLMLAAIANYAEIAGQIPEGHRLELAMAGVLALSEAIKDQPFFYGLASTLEAVQEPRYFARKMVEQYARSMSVPFSGLVHQARKTGIPGLVEADRHRRITAGLTEFEQVMNVIRDGIPGLSSTLPADINEVTGEDILYPPGWGPDIVSPIFVTKLRSDKALEEIARNKASTPPFPKVLVGDIPPELQMTEADVMKQGFPLLPEEIRRGKEIMARELRDGNDRTLHQALTALVTSGEYLAVGPGPGTLRTSAINRTYRWFRDRAIAQLRAENPMIDAEVKKIEQARLDYKTRRDTGPDQPLTIAPGMTLPAPALPEPFIRSLRR